MGTWHGSTTAGRLVEHAQEHDTVIQLSEDVVRLVHRPKRIEDLLTTMVREIAHYGQDSLRIPAALAAMLDDSPRRHTPDTARRSMSSGTR